MSKLIKHTVVEVLIISVFFALVPARAEIVEYNLTIAEEAFNITGKPVRGMTINGGIPGPTLRFKEGDTARIHVRNTMGVATSIHWHGVLVPPDMDGVPYISFPPIKAHTTFTYEFPIRQSGTYWYHSHTSLQEQRGMYGSIVIEPRRKLLHVDRDYVVVLSDWTDENPYAVLRTLKRGSEWYALQKGSGQSIFGAIRVGMMGDYLRRELQRMPAMDISDVAYDRFLANGNPESSLPAHPGETVRLRIIDGSATTFFHLEFAGGPMRIIGTDGLDVEPVQEKRFLIGVAETYDVVVRVPAAGAYEFRATAHDGSGFASVWIGSGERHHAPDVPKPNLYHAHAMGALTLKRVFALTPAGVMGMSDSTVEAGIFDQPGMMDRGTMHDMEHMNHGSEPSKLKMNNTEHGMNVEAGETSHETGMPINHAASPTEDMGHSGHSMPTSSQASQSGKKYETDFRFLAADISSSKNLAADGMDPRRPWTPYEKLRSPKPTRFAVCKPVRIIRLTLDGDMTRYTWFLNNTPLSESDSIRIREGEVVRFIMINRTMMHHPMHLHGHFFRVINSQGDYAPLKHTVNVAPMSTTVIEFDASEVGDWFFHCHLLYHMKSGMARMVHYENFEINPRLASIRPNLYKDSWYFWGQADILSSMTEGFLMLSNTRNIVTADWEGGWQNVDETEWEGILTWDRYINRFFSFFAGADLLGEESELDKTRGVLGFRYLLPFNIESSIWLDTDAGVRINLDREFELTPRLMLIGEVEYDAHERWEGSVSLSYMIHKNFSIISRWHSEYNWGAGVQIRF
jgi:FtsP/CotA-like multicopper oxidase with cupredoxin domain